MIKFSKISAAVSRGTMPTKVSGCPYLPLRPRATLDPDEEARNSTADSHFHFNCTSLSVRHNLNGDTLRFFKGGHTAVQRWKGEKTLWCRVEGKKSGDKLSQKINKNSSLQQIQEKLVDSKEPCDIMTHNRNHQENHWEGVLPLPPQEKISKTNIGKGKNVPSTI